MDQNGSQATLNESTTSGPGGLRPDSELRLPVCRHYDSSGCSRWQIVREREGWRIEHAPVQRPAACGSSGAHEDNDSTPCHRLGMPKPRVHRPPHTGSCVG